MSDLEKDLKAALARRMQAVRPVGSDPGALRDRAVRALRRRRSAQAVSGIAGVSAMGALVAVFVLGSADAVGPLSHPQATRSDPPTPSPGVTVWPGTYGVVFVSALRGMVYDAYDLRVDRGDTIVFTVRADDSSHSFTVNDDLDSGPLSTDETKRMRVTLPPGVYDYRCTVVPYMVGGKLTVGPVPLSTPMGPGPTRPSPAR